MLPSCGIFPNDTKKNIIYLPRKWFAEEVNAARTPTRGAYHVSAPLHSRQRQCPSQTQQIRRSWRIGRSEINCNGWRRIDKIYLHTSFCEHTRPLPVVAVPSQALFPGFPSVTLKKNDNSSVCAAPLPVGHCYSMMERGYSMVRHRSCTTEWLVMPLCTAGLNNNNTANIHIFEDHYL